MNSLICLTSRLPADQNRGGSILGEEGNTGRSTTTKQSTMRIIAVDRTEFFSISQIKNTNNSFFICYGIFIFAENFLKTYSHVKRESFKSNQSADQ